MPRRFKKKVSKIRGTRTCSRGNSKKGRGKGNRGGVGRAGMNKHKWTYMIKYEENIIHRSGFKNPGNPKSYDTINVFMLDNMARHNKLKKQDDKYVFEFKGKILGAGEITVPVNVKALKATDKAIKKIKSAGGDVELQNQI